MKRICFAIILIFITVNFGVFAIGEPTITVSEAEAKAGETVDVTISLSDNPGIISMLLKVEYDQEAMSLKGVKDAGILGSEMHSDNFSNNPYYLFWSNGTVEEDIKSNGVAVTLAFEISENAKSGKYPIKVDYDKDDDAIFNFNLENVDFAVVNGGISVQSSGDDAQNSDIDISGGEGSSQPEIQREITVILDGSYIIFADQKPVIKDDRTLIPLRAIFEALGATVDWDDETKTVVSEKGDVEISLTIGSDQLYVNGKAKTIDVPAQIINDRTMVPLRAVAESFGCKVDWVGETKTVIITN